MPVTIINGPTMARDGTVSTAIDVSLGTIIRIFVPPEWTYAPLSFLLSPDNVLPYATVCHSNGRERVLDVQANSMVLGTIVPGGWLKFQSGYATKLIPQRTSVAFRVAVLT